MNGTYAFVFAGEVNLAIGFLTVVGDHFTGADCGGGRYEGTIAEESSGNLRLLFERFAPRGIAGRSSAPMPPPARIELRMPPAFGDGQPIHLEVARDSVTMMVKRVPDRWASYAAGISLWPERLGTGEREPIASQLFSELLN
jgi:hypothetical protein